MTFINVKELKSVVSESVKIADKNNLHVAINLSKEGELSFSVLFGTDGMVVIPVPSRTVKKRSQSIGKSVSVDVEKFSHVVKSLPVTMEEVEIEIFDENRMTLSGEYDPDSRLEYEVLNSVSLYCRDYDNTEEKLVEFATSVEIATALTAASALARKSEQFALGYIHITGADDELLVEATDGCQVYQKYVYTQEVFSPSVDIAVSPSLGIAVGKFAFKTALWEVYQNFVKVTLDSKIQVYATRSLVEFPKNLSRFMDTSDHANVVLNPNELKSRLSKVNPKTHLWLYTQGNQLAIEYFDRDSHGKIVVKNALKTAPAYAIVECKRLMQILKLVKKTTDSIVLRLPKLPSEAEVKAIHKGQTPMILLEFDRNSHAIGGGKNNILTAPPGIKGWFISQGWSVFPESQPASTKARSVADILSDRWTGQGWERPELIECDCGSIHLGELAVQYEQVFDDCECCERERPLILQRIDYRCSCNVRNTSTYNEPILEPICMGCGKKDEFTVTHYFQCANCNKSKIFETLQFEVVADCKVCPCGAVVIEEELPLWHCDNCDTKFTEDNLFDDPHFEGVDPDTFQEYFDSSGMAFIVCPSCKSKDSNLASQPKYWCGECSDSITFVYPLPAVLSAPTLPCPDCDKDLHDIPTQALTDLFLVGTVARF